MLLLTGITCAPLLLGSAVFIRFRCLHCHSRAESSIERSSCATAVVAVATCVCERVSRSRLQSNSSTGNGSLARSLVQQTSASREESRVTREGEEEEARRSMPMSPSQSSLAADSLWVFRFSLPLSLSCLNAAPAAAAPFLLVFLVSCMSLVR